AADDLALPRRELAVGLLVLRVPQPLQDHLTGGGRRDAAESLGRVVPLGDQVAVVVGLLDEHAHRAGLLIDVDARVRMGTGVAPVCGVLVGGEQGRAQRVDDRAARDPLLLLESVEGAQVDIHLSFSFAAAPGAAPCGPACSVSAAVPDSAISRGSGFENSTCTTARSTASSAISRTVGPDLPGTTSSTTAGSRAESRAPTLPTTVSSPVRTSTRRPRALRQCRGRVRGLSTPREVTSSVYGLRPISGSASSTDDTVPVSSTTSSSESPVSASRITRTTDLAPADVTSTASTSAPSLRTGSVSRAITCSRVGTGMVSFSSLALRRGDHGRAPRRGGAAHARPDATRTAGPGAARRRRRTRYGCPDYRANAGRLSGVR